MRLVIVAVVLFVTVAMAWVLGTFAAEMYSKGRKREAQQMILRQMDDLKVGDTLVDWEFENLQFQGSRMSESVGGRTLVYVVDPECHTCVEDIEVLSRLTGTGDAELPILIISGGNPRYLLDWQRKYSLPIPILYDHGRAFCQSLDITTYPFHFVISKELVVEELMPGTLEPEYVENFVKGKHE